jgi:hypothetical protein
MKRFTNVRVLVNWATYCAIITLLCVIIYVVAQQNFRQGANDPQFQMTEDAADALNNGADPKSLVNTTSPIEISKSLSPYLIIYDAAGKIVVSNAMLHNKVLQIPAGVLAYIQKNGNDAASWQPEPGVRQAMVGTKAAGSKTYTVIAGRSLRKTEERIALLGEQVLFGWFCSVIGMFLIAFLLDFVTRRWSKNVQVA